MTWYRPTGFSKSHQPGAGGFRTWGLVLEISRCKKKTKHWSWASLGRISIKSKKNFFFFFCYEELWTPTGLFLFFFLTYIFKILIFFQFISFLRYIWNSCPYIFASWVLLPSLSKSIRAVAFLGWVGLLLLLPPQWDCCLPLTAIASLLSSAGDGTACFSGFCW